MVIINKMLAMNFLWGIIHQYSYIYLYTIKHIFVTDDVDNLKLDCALSFNSFLCEKNILPNKNYL